VGTFSKSLFPSLRIGYVIAPAWALPALTAAKQQADWHGAATTQDTLATFIAQGHLARHIRRMRKRYAERRQVLMHAVARHATGLLHAVPYGGGLHATALLRDDLDARSLVDAAADAGIRVASIAGFCMQGPAPNGLVFGLGMIPTERIDDGIAALMRRARALQRSVSAS